MAYFSDMNSERLFGVVTMELTTDRLKLEDDLERVINSSVDISEKVASIKQILSSISILELSINKFNNMINKQKTTQNGEG